MKYLILIISFLIFSISNGQQLSTDFTYEDFGNQILKYEPIQRAGVTDKDFKRGLTILDETKSVVEYDATNLNSADYWNVIIVFLKIGEPTSHIELAFKKAISFPKNNICEYIESMGTAGLEHIIPETFNAFYSKCETKPSEDFSLSEYIATNNLNTELVTLIDEISKSDQSIRKQKLKNNKAMKARDLKNQKLIDSLYKVHKTYLGSTLVGEKYKSTMWLVIQHSNVEMMEKYLPIVHRAVQNNELGKGPLKMLIDRFYGLKYGYQVFGSQSGF
ncbi:MAG: hypothetical protein AB8B90_07045, partial [Psychroserpens sp.]